MNEKYLSHSKDNYQYSLPDHPTSHKKERRELAISPYTTKEQHSKSFMKDILSVTNHNKDLKREIQQMVEKLQSKEHEIINLKYQLEMRESPDGLRPQEKENTLTQRCTNRSPASGEYNENKNSKNFRANDSRKQKTYEEENKNLRKEIERLKEKLNSSEGKRLVLKKELGRSQDLASRDHNYRFSVLEDEREELEKNNQALKLKVERLTDEIASLMEEKGTMKSKYDELKTSYDKLEALTSHKFSDYSIPSTPQSDLLKSTKDTPTSNRLFGLGGKMRGEDSLSSIKASAELSDLGLNECRRILAEIMDIYVIKNPNHIITSIRKTEKVIQAIPRLRKLIADVSAIVLPRVGIDEDGDQVELIIPSLKKCFKGLDELEGLKGMKNKLIDMLELDPESTNYEIMKKIDNLILSTYQYSDTKSQRGMRDSSDKMLVDSFTKIFGVKPDIALFKQIDTQLEDLKRFTNFVKQKSSLNFSLKSETCLKYVLKLLENSAKDKEAADVAAKIQKVLNCKLEALPKKVEELVAEKFRYNPFNTEVDA